jgi:hypothetical protein
MQRPPNDGRGGGGPAQPSTQTQKLNVPSTQRQPTQRLPTAQPAPHVPQPPPVPAPKAASPPTAPAIIVSRTIQVGGSSSRSRPAMPAIAIGPPGKPAPVAAPPPPPRGPIEFEGSAPHGEHAPPPSVRPTAPEMAASNGQTSIVETFERLLSSDDLDAGFATLERQTGSTALLPGVALTDLAEVRTLFAQLAAGHVRQVRDFMIDLRWSEPTVDWLPICEPALRSLRRAAEKLELPELCVALDDFAQALAAANTEGAHTIAGAHREMLLARYEELSRLMPHAFALDLDRTQREAIILQSLLLQVPGVKKVTLGRMYAAGLTTLEAMFLATPADLAATAGISEPLAAEIVERFRAYRDQIKATVPDATRARERERVAELTARLRREHDEHERAAESWSRDAAERKKELRKAREQTLLDIQVLLARLGEVDRLEALDRMPFGSKVAHLESFLEEARDRYVAQS